MKSVRIFLGTICASWLALGLLFGCASGHPKSPNNDAVASSDGSATAGQAATFSVTAVGTPPLSYQWYFNPSNNENTLLLTNVEASNGSATNQTATFTVAGGTNRTPLYYQWQFNGTNISGATNN